MSDTGWGSPSDDPAGTDNKGTDDEPDEDGPERPDDGGFGGSGS